MFPIHFQGNCDFAKLVCFVSRCLVLSSVNCPLQLRIASSVGAGPWLSDLSSLGDPRLLVCLSGHVSWFLTIECYSVCYLLCHLFWHLLCHLLYHLLRHLLCHLLCHLMCHLLCRLALLLLGFPPVAWLSSCWFAPLLLGSAVAWVSCCVALALIILPPIDCTFYCFLALLLVVPPRVAWLSCCLTLQLRGSPVAWLPSCCLALLPIGSLPGCWTLMLLVLSLLRDSPVAFPSSC